MDKTRHTPRLDLIPLSKSQLKWTLDSPLRQAQGSANPLEENLGIKFDNAIIDENVIRAISMKLAKMVELPIEKHLWQTYWLIVERDKNIGIGLIGFKSPPNEDGLSEVGYGISSAYQNRGYMSEALRGLLDWAFEQPDCRGVTATMVLNPASARVLQKLGATLVEENHEKSSWIFRKEDERHSPIIRPLSKTDDDEWLRMRITLWPDNTEEEMRADLDVWHSDTDNATFVVDRSNGRLGGFIEIGQRKYAEGCETSPVAYIEGWYIDEDLRKQGWGKALVMAGEDWARKQALTEIASDTWLENETSIQAHLALGYQEEERLVTFRKKL